MEQIIENLLSVKYLFKNPLREIHLQNGKTQVNEWKTFHPEVGI